LQNSLAALPHVATIRSFMGSLPDKSTLNVADQLGAVKKGVDDGTAKLQQALSSGSSGGLGGDALTQLQSAASQLADAGAYLLQLALAYPDADQNGGYVEAMRALSQLSSYAGKAVLETGAIQAASKQLQALSTRRDPSSRALPQEQQRIEGAPRRLHLGRRHRHSTPGGVGFWSLQP
jgi:hypothetical protein